MKKKKRPHQKKHPPRNNNLSLIPAVGTLTNRPELAGLVQQFCRPLLTRITRDIVAQIKKQKKPVHDEKTLCSMIVSQVKHMTSPFLKRVINATGVVIHTNMGRAPMSRTAAESVALIARGYSNLEFDLETGQRGNRQTRLRELLSLITGAEDALAVNNNAAAILLVLRTFAVRKEIIVSRGELIEIGDSFRLPDIMREGGARLVEVGTTNRTRLSDYQKAITDRTAILLKVHKSNFKMTGFTEEVDIRELTRLAHKHGLIAMHDLGSGLLKAPEGLLLKNEPTVRDVITAGVDLVTFSGDKLLGGPQSGVIAGRRMLVQKLAKAPLMRALRPGKLTLAALEQLLLEFLSEDRLVTENPVFQMIGKNTKELERSATTLAVQLNNAGIQTKIIENKSQVGGGALPGLELDSRAVEIISPLNEKQAARHYAETLYKTLLKGSPPVVAILREGKLIFDVRTLDFEDLDPAARAIIAAVQMLSQA